MSEKQPLRNNAACCIRLRDLRENNTQAYSINPHKRNHNVSRRSCWFTKTNLKTTNRKTVLITPICLSLRNNAACCIPLCVICAICGRKPRKHTQSICVEMYSRVLKKLYDLKEILPFIKNRYNIFYFIILFVYYCMFF